MPPFVVSKDMLGSDLSIRIDGKSLKQVKNYGEDFVTGSDVTVAKALDEIFPVFGIEVPDLVPGELRLSYETIHTGNNVNWMRALGKERFVKNLKIFSQGVEKGFEKVSESPYLNTLVESRRLLERLQPALVDREEVERLLSESENGFLRSFLPERGHELPVVKYSHDSATGRLRVTSGPKILNLAKQHRQVLKSRFRKGVIALIDFVSLEPRTTLLLTRDETPLDIYEAMRGETGSELSRAKLKVATLASLYGSTHSDPATMSVVNKFFRTHEIHERHLSSTPLVNLYGRPLVPENDRLRLPYFIQSTSVDVSLIGFGKIARKYLEMVPLFVLHDALVVDIESDLYRELASSPMEINVEPLGKYFLSIKRVEQDT